ncbi:hypothetical protein Btru_054444 [Bulinus truncatus]|nr:hypothetical protein Btru_054444 [Bulinus truncatus]
MKVLTGEKDWVCYSLPNFSPEADVTSIMCNTNERFLLILTSLVVVYNTAQCVAVVCEEYCVEGEYCDGKVCIPCPQGFYQKFRSHKITSCNPMTVKTGKGWKLLRPGNSSSDNQWVCDTGYDTYNNNGTIECRETGQQTTTDLMTTDSETNNETVITSTPIPSNENNLNVGAMVGGIVGGVVFLTATGLILFRCRKKLHCVSLMKKYNRTPDLKTGNNNGSLLADYESRVINSDKSNSDERSKVSVDAVKPKNDDYNSNENSKETICSTPENVTNPKPQFHATNVSNIEQKPIQSTSGVSPGGIELNEMNSDEKKKVNEAFKRMCYELCIKLGRDGDYILDVLNLQSNDQSKRYETIFVDGLSKWSADFPFNAIEDGLWLPLSKLKLLLKDKKRQDLVESFEDLTKDVMKHINALNKIK